MGKVILTVDDSASIRQLVKFTLKKAGYDVLEGFNGKDGLSVAKDNKVDMVITDLNMPEMDGITLIAKLRELSNYKYIPIIMLTTESDASMKQKGKAAGATGWIVKPFKPEQLLTVIKKVLK